jgi:hypoxanthine phosphoribosyltransferase
MERIKYNLEIDIGEIRGRIKELGKIITRDYEGKNLCLVGVLKGSVCFLSDLMQSIKLPFKLEFIGVSTYGDRTSPGKEVTITYDMRSDFTDLEILVVEDIVDTGITLEYLLGQLEERGPTSIKVCALLNKTGRRKTDVSPDYVGFEVENRYFIGYGLDYKGYYRHLPFLASVEEEGE